jgi:hypothetical protein
MLIESPLVEDAGQDGCEPLFVSPVPQSSHRVAIAMLQLPFSGAHSIMMGKFSQPGVGVGARPSPFTISTITYKVVVYVPDERADTLPIFLLYSVACPVHEGGGGKITLLKFLNNLWGTGNRVGLGLSYWPARLHRLTELIPWN